MPTTITHSDPPASPAPSSSRRRGARQWVLGGLLALAAVALPLSRRLLPTMPPPPAANADDAARVRYDLARLRAHPTDGEAYLDMGQIAVRRGFYMDALNQFAAARALGAPERRLAGPKGRCLLRLSRHKEASEALETAARLNPDSVEVALDLATLRQDQNDDGGAVRIVRDFLRRHPALEQRPTPTDLSALEQFGAILTSANQPQAALALARQEMRLDPNSAAANVLAGKNLLTLGRPQEALVPLQAAARLASDAPSLHHLYASALMQVPGHQDEALAQWRQTVALDPADGEAFFQIGRSYEARGDWRRAAVGYMQALQLNSHGAEAARRAARNWQRVGRGPEATFCRAQASQMAGDSQAALVAFLALSRSPDPRWREQGIDGAADLYHKAHRYEEYLALIRGAAKSGAITDTMRLADAYGNLTDWGKRRQTLQEVLPQAASTDKALAAHIHHELGTIAENQGARDEAEREYSQAIALHPDKSEYHSMLAGLYLDRRSEGGRDALAVREAQRAAELAPDSAAAFHQLGIAYRAVGALALSRQALQHAIDLQPGFGIAYQELGKTLKQMGLKDQGDTLLTLYRRYEAFDLERQTLTTRARAHLNDPAPQIALADFYVRARDYSHAVQFYERAVRLAPAAPLPRRHLARLYRLLDRAEDAAAQERTAERAKIPQPGKNSR